MIAAAAVLGAPAGASAKLLDDYYNEGIEPHADLGTSRSIASPKRIRLEFSASVLEPIYGEYTVTCKIRGAAKFNRQDTFSGVAPVFAVVPITRRFDSCRVTQAEARFSNPFWSGWLRVRVWGSG